MRQTGVFPVSKVGTRPPPLTAPVFQLSKSFFSEERAPQR